MTARTDETKAFDLASLMEEPITDLRTISDILLRMIETDSVGSNSLANTLGFISNLILRRCSSLESNRCEVFNLLHKHCTPLPPEARIR